jgi:hypothetical protein
MIMMDVKKTSALMILKHAHRVLNLGERIEEAAESWDTAWLTTAYFFRDTGRLIQLRGTQLAGLGEKVLSWCGLDEAEVEELLYEAALATR